MSQSLKTSDVREERTKKPLVSSFHSLRALRAKQSARKHPGCKVSIFYSCTVEESSRNYKITEENPLRKKQMRNKLSCYNRTLHIYFLRGTELIQSQINPFPRKTRIVVSLPKYIIFVHFSFTCLILLRRRGNPVL